MHVFQTAGVPPNRGKIILAIIGSSRNINAALTNNVTANRKGMSTPRLMGRSRIR